MADNDIRDLEQKLKETPDDTMLKARLRLAYVRSAQPEKAKPLLKGDRVIVIETDNVWIKNSWEGEIVEVLTDGDCNIRPLNSDQNWNVKPSSEYLQSGLYITSDDVSKCVIYQPVMPE